MEKLIQEIAEIWKPWYGGYCPHWLKAERTRATIELIGKAYVGGLKLPGELSRDITGDDQLIIIIGASQGMALRKEEE